MDNFYRENILDHYRNPRNFSDEKLEYNNEVGNPLCGDRIGMGIKIKASKTQSFKEENNIIEDIHFWGEGCAVSMSSASMFTEFVKGKTTEEAKKIGKEKILEFLGIELTPTRLKCALLPLEVFQNTLALVK